MSKSSKSWRPEAESCRARVDDNFVDMTGSTLVEKEPS
jgi:hypothetical protein